MKANSKFALGIVGVGLFAAALSLLIQPPTSWDASLASFHYSLSANSLTFWLHLGAASLFVMSLTVYKEKLRRAFSGVILGIVLIALGTFQLPVLDALDKWNSWYVTHGVIGLPFLAGGLIMYIGARAFGRLIGDKGLLTKWVVMVPAIVALSGAVVLLPHVKTTVDEMSYDLGNVTLTLTMLFVFASMLVFLRIRQRIGTHYKQAMLWTAIALSGSTLSLVLAIIDTLISTATRDSLTEVLNVVTVLAGFAWLRAGYLFTTTKEY